MKILYAIQGTGNGHISRACNIIPELKKHGHVDVLISGIESSLSLPFSVTYSLYGLSFIFGSKGNVDILSTIKKMKLKQLFHNIQHIPVEKYDIVINDFEPVTAWACKIKKIPCISVSHQAAVIHPKAPRPKRTDVFGNLILRYYAPAKIRYGIHFIPYDSTIFSPVIRNEIRQTNISNNGHYTVYLPSYNDSYLCSVFSQLPQVTWHIFSKHSKKIQQHGNVTIHPISHEKFITSLCSCEGIICGAGFETPAEALFLRKKLLVIPMKNQYEQLCNAQALKELDVPVLYSLKNKHIPIIETWTKTSQNICIDIPENTSHIIQTIVSEYNTTQSKIPLYPDNSILSSI